MPEMLDPLVDSEHVCLLSVMDHTPGQRQFASLETYRAYYKGTYGMSDADVENLISKRVAEQQRCGVANREHVVAHARRRGLPVASHDDATAEHVATAAADEPWLPDFCRALFDAEYGRGQDNTERPALAAALDAAGADPEPWLAAAGEPATKAALRDRVEEARTNGIFGAPTFLSADGELFWGDDRLEAAVAWAAESSHK